MRRRALFILGSCLLLALAVMGGWKLRQGVSRRAPVSVDPTVLHATWIRGVDTALAAYDQDQDAAKARDALLALRVNAQDRQPHQELVFALEALVTGQAGASSRFETARNAFLSSKGTQP